MVCASTGAAARKAPGTYREELNCLALEQGLEGQLSLREKLAETIVPLLSPHLQAQAGATFESPPTWLTLCTLPW